MRAPRQATRPRFPRPRSDASRHRGPGCQADRAGIAAFLSPLRTWPALRCPSKAWTTRAAAIGRRSQSASSSDLRSSRLGRSRNKGKATGGAGNFVRPARRSHHSRSALGRRNRGLLLWPFGPLRKVQRWCCRSRAEAAPRSAIQFVFVRPSKC